MTGWRPTLARCAASAGSPARFRRLGRFRPGPRLDLHRRGWHNGSRGNLGLPSIMDLPHEEGAPPSRTGAALDTAALATSPRVKPDGGYLPPMVSYAQNFEDVMLRRALQDIACGFYVDIGAADPDADSVTRWFYEQGWRGINVEPDPRYFRRLEGQRQAAGRAYAPASRGDETDSGPRRHPRSAIGPELRPGDRFPEDRRRGHGGRHSRRRVLCLAAAEDHRCRSDPVQQSDPVTSGMGSGITGQGIQVCLV